MTMFTAENRQHQQQSCGGYGVYGGGGGGGVEGFGGGMSHSLEGCYILSDQILMAAAAEEDHHHSTAEDDRKAESSSKDDELVITSNHEQEQDEQEEEEEEQGWLQLGIGGGRSNRIKKLNGKNNGNENENESGRVELELMPSSSNNNNNNNNSSQLMMRSTFAPPLLPEFRAPRPVLNFETSGGGGFISQPPSSSFFLQQYGISGTNYYPHQEMNWAAFRHVPIISNIGGAASSSQTSSSLTYYPRPAQFQLYAAGVDMEAAAAAAAVDFRVIPPPRRPHSGIWFMLQASQNQEKEPFLPQISKSYLRIKDGGMTIRLVIKYLVNKLRLDNESEVEITCKGQRVASFLTLEHVRDSIWSSSNPNRDFITLLPNSSTIPHIMVLHYARTSTS